MSRPAVFQSVHDQPPIVIDAEQVVDVRWQGADYNRVLVLFTGGAVTDLHPSDLGLDLAGQLATPDQAEWCVRQVLKAVGLWEAPAPEVPS